MATRQDQLHSYQFTLQRVVAALVLHETDPPRSPFRRVAGATLAGVLVAALALAATAVRAVLVPSGTTRWRDGGAVIVERETGARYVFRDGRLHPVLNYASALLILGSAVPDTVLVDRAAMDGVPRGVPLGVPGAPDSLPPPGALVGPPWTVCATPSESLVLVGPPEVAGRSLGAGGVLVRSPDGAVHLLWSGRRHRVREPAVVLAALGWGGEPVLPIAAPVLAALPAGADLARLSMPERGRPVRWRAGIRVGEVVAVTSQGGGRQYAVALHAGLAALTQVEADLLLGDPLTASLAGQRKLRVLGPGEYALLPRTGPLVPPAEGALPRTSPVLVRPDGALCFVVRSGSGAVEVLVDAALPDDAGATPGRVLVPPGRGALVAAGAVYLVTDLGRRYELVGPDVPAVLGFAGVVPVALPPGVVALVPPGPALELING